jgi:2-isopropylmalate synthase
MMGYIDQDLSKLDEYCRFVSRVCHVPIAPNYMVVGRDAFRTGTGVHAAAIIKAEKKGHAWLADRVYSGVPASLVGRHQVIEIGPMSGESNVIYWLGKRGIDPTREVVEKIFRAAKQSHRVLTDEELFELIGVGPAYVGGFD